ncbi:response regulator transcription factor [Alkalihalobacillus sp. LMS39]|uniref:response regulator transcription factor n=1 Tax=Alkalihalobacillus sp. LMS39 TaxID=2924032 RepID=UPI001FB22FBC|nr:response regulator transcription factor [Alkalihalobacillus sp. LMS39]UOE94953.1 response regulator transcription factor [Alkalihalobacillus sp. LMS39]
MWSVVIVDDDNKVLRGMKKVIPWEKLNCQWVGEAQNGKAGIEIIEKTQPDIIITDIYMPVMNGLEMIQELKQTEFDSKVIILSGYNDFEYARQAMRLRIDDYLSKPASIDTITDVLYKVIENLEQERKEKEKVVELRQKVSIYEPLLEKQWVKSVISGTADVWNTPTEVQSLVRKWETKNHIILAMTYDESVETSCLQSDWDLFRFAASNIIEEVTEQFFDDFEYIEHHVFQSSICLHLDKEETNIEATIEEYKRIIESKFQDCLQVQATIKVGTMKEDWREIPSSMKDALFPGAREEAESKEVPQHLLWSQSMQVSQKLSEAIRYADYDKACQLINDYFANVEKYPFHKKVAVRIGIEMWTVMTYSLYDIGIKNDEMYANDFDLYQELSDKSSWDEVRHYLNENVKRMCSHQQWEENSKHRKLVEQMIAYVQNHLSENITLQDIANELYISRNYLGQIFKNIVGESFKNYMTRARMEVAKKMIQEGNYLIYEVSEKVGYVNPAYFTTTFKKYTGYTPTDLIHKKSVNQ